jgi:hypothetical protein
LARSIDGHHADYVNAAFEKSNDTNPFTVFAKKVRERILINVSPKSVHIELADDRRPPFATHLGD